MKSLSMFLKTTALLGLALLLASAAFAGEAIQYGDELTVVETTPIHKILADPDGYLGKTVRIEGGVLDVCPVKGCWMEVGDGEESIKVKVDDDVIVFPKDAKGGIVAAQGVVEAVVMERDEYVEYLAHLAEEKGETFDAETVKLGDGPFRIIRIKGIGAKISAPV